MNPVTIRNRKPADATGAVETPPSVVKAAAAELARRLGLRQGRLRTINPHHEQLLKAGAKLDLHISRERFEVMLRPEDVGLHSADPNDKAALAAEEAMNSLIDLGTRRQLPERWPSSPEDAKHGPIQDLNAVDDQARYYLTKHSHRTHWGWFVAEGKAECGHCGPLAEPKANLSDHLKAYHEEEYARFVGLATTELGLRHIDISDRTVEDGLVELIDTDEAAFGAFMGRYPLAIGNYDVEGKPGRERGWHFREVIARLEQFKVEYEAVGQRIVDEWDQLMANTRRDYAILGFQNYERLRDHARRLGPQVLEKFETDYGTLEEYVHDFVERMVQGIPSVEQVARSFSFEIETSHIPLSSELELDKLRAERIRTQTVIARTEARVAEAKEAERIRVETAQDRLTAETLEAETRVLAAQTAERVRLARKIEQDLADERKARASEMERSIARQAQKRLEDEVFTFMDTLRANLRGQVYDTVVDALATIQNKDKLSAGSVKGVRGLLDTVSRLDFYNEPDLRAKIEEVAGLLDGKAVDRDERLIAEKLREIGAESRLILMDLDRPPRRSAAAFGIPDGAEDLVQQLARPQRHEGQIEAEPLPLEPERRPVRHEALAI
jgi:hypothetical protein